MSRPNDLSLRMTRVIQRWQAEEKSEFTLKDFDREGCTEQLVAHRCFSWGLPYRCEVLNRTQFKRVFQVDDLVKAMRRRNEWKS